MKTPISLLFLVIAVPALAGTASVENNVSVEARSQAGTSSAEVRIKTIINGEIITDEKIHKESTGTPVKIEKKITNIEKSVERNQNDKYFKNFFRRFFRRFRFW